MAFQIPVYLLGRHTAAVLIAPAAVNPTTGVGTIGTAQDLSTAGGARLLRGYMSRLTPQKENITPSDSRVANGVIVEDDFEVTVRELLTTVGIPYLGQLLNVTDYFYFQFSQISAAGVLSFAGVAVRGEFQSDLAGNKGENVAELTGSACGIPSYYGPQSANPFVL